MVSQKAIDELRGQGGIDWITALKSVSMRALVEQARFGLYVIRTSLQAKRMDAPSCVRSYKALAKLLDDAESL